MALKLAATLTLVSQGSVETQSSGGKYYNMCI